MFLALDVLFNLNVEDGVATGDLGISVHLDAVGAEQLGAVEALRDCFAVLLADHLADVAERILRGTLPTDDFRQTGHEEVVRKFLDPADRKLGPLATQRTRELSIVAVLLVAGL